MKLYPEVSLLYHLYGLGLIDDPPEMDYPGFIIDYYFIIFKLVALLVVFELSFSCKLIVFTFLVRECVF